MRRPTLLLTALVATATLAIVGTALAGVPDAGNDEPGTPAATASHDQPTEEASAPAARSSEVAEPWEGPGTTDGPVHACLTVDGREVCDTFGESDEGPGTTIAPADPDAAPIAPASRAGEVAEPWEGPGTTDGPVHACLTLDGGEVCDTFGESDEGPGTR